MGQSGREAQEGKEICILIAGSRCCQQKLTQHYNAIIFQLKRKPSQQLYQGSMIIIPILQREKVRHKTVSDLVKSPELAGGRAEILFQTVCLPNLCSHLPFLPSTSGTTRLVRIGISKLLSGRDDLHLHVSLEDSRTFSLSVNVAEAVGMYHQHTCLACGFCSRSCLHLFMT